MKSLDLTVDDFLNARKRIKEAIHETPVQSATRFGREIGVDLYLKCENLQKTGSFKVRGALNAVYQLDSDSKTRGVITASAGNFAQALALASNTAEISCTVVMPSTASQSKINASKSYGAEVVLHDNVLELFDKTFSLARERGLTVVHSFDDLNLIAGHGSIGLEILEQIDNVDVIVVAIGGGGLISGIAAAAKLLKPGIRIFGVEPVGAASMRQSLDTGSAVKLDAVDTIADGLGAPMAGEITFEFVKKYVDDVVTVTDADIAEAMGVLLSTCKLLTEPAGAASLAALRKGVLPCRGSDRVVAVLSGGNIDLDRLKTLI